MAQEVLGLLCVAVGVQFSVLANTVAKFLADVPLLRLMQARFLLQCVISGTLCLLLKLCGRDVRFCGPPGRRGLLLLRSCMSPSGLGCFWYALRVLPLGEATATMYLSPVINGFLARLLLRERLSSKFLLQAAVSFVGMLLILDPFTASSFFDGGQQHFVAFSVALVGCVCFAAGDCTVRLLQDVHPMELQFYQDALTALLFLPVVRGALDAGTVWGSWTDLWQVLYLVAFTLCGLAASILVIVGYSLAPVGKAAPFAYLEVPSAFVVQVLLFDVVPDLVKGIGAALIVLAAAGRFWCELRAVTKTEASSALKLPLLTKHSSCSSTPSTSPAGSSKATLSPASGGSCSVKEVPSTGDVRQTMLLQGSVTYAVFTEEQPCFWPQVTETATPARYQSMSLEAHAVDVVNGRLLDLTFDRSGLELVPDAPTRLTACAFQDDTEVVQTYYREVEALLKGVTGCSRVVVFNHARRSSANAGGKADGKTRDPSAFVHGDYSPDAALERLSQVLPEEAQALQSKRVCIVNVWRSAAGFVEQKPLALILNSCDVEARSLGEVRDVQTVFPGCMQCASSTRFVSYSPLHRWAVFPRMAAEEALVFKVFDSEDRLGILHTALDDSEAAAGENTAPLPRESIETRAFCIWD